VTKSTPADSDDRVTRGRISDYSRIAARYDSTRNLPDDVLLTCYKRLIQTKILPAAGKILDAGCGTGQASLPLAALGYEIFGIDVSKEMTSIALSKVHPNWQADYIVGDVRSIQAENNNFDAAVVSKLFQHVQNWPQACRELIRVVRSGGYIIQVNERGTFGNAVRRYFAQRADELGFKGRYFGLNPHSDGELLAFMQSQSCQPVTVDMSDLRWDMSISYGEALSRIRERLFAEFWYLPENVYDELLAVTQAWIDAQPEGADTIQHLTPYLAVKIFQTPRNG
jgi:ubiquinone/menaquinone biosynthesis C-methylase UbiE